MGIRMSNGRNEQIVLATLELAAEKVILATKQLFYAMEVHKVLPSGHSSYSG